MTYAWIDCGYGRQVLRKVRQQTEARSDLPCPMLIGDNIEPTKSMVTGEIFTSKAALRATYKASGNKKGVEYIEVGNEPQPIPPRPRPNRKAIRHSVQSALSKVGIAT